MSKPRVVCVVCRRRPAKGALLCDPCGRSYDRGAAKDVTIAAALRWAASRAWRFAKSSKSTVPESDK